MDRAPWVEGLERARRDRGRRELDEVLDAWSALAERSWAAGLPVPAGSEPEHRVRELAGTSPAPGLGALAGEAVRAGGEPDRFRLIIDTLRRRAAVDPREVPPHAPGDEPEPGPAELRRLIDGAGFSLITLYSSHGVEVVADPRCEGDILIASTRDSEAEALLSVWEQVRAFRDDPLDDDEDWGPWDDTPTSYDDPVRTILNLIWLVLAGVWLAIGYLIAAVILCITIIGIPFAVQAIKLAGYALWPFGRALVPSADRIRPLSAVGNVLWFVLAGWWLALEHLIAGILLCVTIIGIPLGSPASRWPARRSSRSARRSSGSRTSPHSAMPWWSAERPRAALRPGGAAPPPRAAAPRAR